MGKFIKDYRRLRDMYRECLRNILEVEPEADEIKAIEEVRNRRATEGTVPQEEAWKLILDCELKPEVQTMVEEALKDLKEKGGTAHEDIQWK